MIADSLQRSSRPARRKITFGTGIADPDDTIEILPTPSAHRPLSRIFLTADTHFGDPHILRQRAFPSLDAHDATLIARWNATVGPDDDVWHLGDFAAGASRARCREIFDALAGRKHLVAGNHDTNRVLELPWAEPPVESRRLTRADATGTEVRLYLAALPASLVAGPMARHAPPAWAHARAASRYDALVRRGRGCLGLSPGRAGGGSGAAGGCHAAAGGAEPVRQVKPAGTAPGFRR